MVEQPGKSLQPIDQTVEQGTHSHPQREDNTIRKWTHTYIEYAQSSGAEPVYLVMIYTSRE